MNSLLIYSPNLIGHPEVYTRFIIESLSPFFEQVTLASFYSEEVCLKEYAQIRECASDVDINFIQVGSCPEDFDSINLLSVKETQTTCRADLTIFIEADKLSRLIDDLHAGRGRLSGRTLAIYNFASLYWLSEPYLIEEFYSSKNTQLANLLKKLKNRCLGKIPIPKLRNYFYSCIRKEIFDIFLLKDERVVKSINRKNVQWMPEIFKPGPLRTDASNVDVQESVEAKLLQHCTKLAGKENVILYFGAAAFYKGYDKFLALLCQDTSLCGLHIGLPLSPNSGFGRLDGLEDTRTKLKEQKRLFESNSYVRSQTIVDHLFANIEYFVSTHRLTLSSGTMLQAIEYSKPVLAPNAGLIGWRVNKYKCGFTYKANSNNSLGKKLLDFKKDYKEAYVSDGVKAKFSIRASRNFWKELVRDL